MRIRLSKLRQIIKETLGPIATMEQDALIWLTTIIIVEVTQLVSESTANGINKRVSPPE